MALSPLKSKALHHGRSLSLPSKSHPAISQFIENLAKTKSSSSTLSSMVIELTSLKSLYCNIDDLLVLPHIQHVISQERHEKFVEQLLDRHVTLLDACTTAKDIISHTKHDVQHLLSSLRRKDIVYGIKNYQTSRRKSKKTIEKTLKELRKNLRKDNTLSLEKDTEKTSLVCMLKDAESVTFFVLESLLAYAMGTKVQERKSGWSLVSKLMHSKKISHQSEETNTNEFNKVDSFLQLSQEEELVNHLKEMDSNIQVLEQELECLFRQLVKTRVFLLNIINH
ncbi:hypothetical protein DH2020_047576 [Rehmannia glutinosa]|uniref:DUF241 domain protein n=1 Tax=Rehmannia glutinosa TaxID=99300 RepID=A0ABR0U832_REHGL